MKNADQWSPHADLRSSTPDQEILLVYRQVINIGANKPPILDPFRESAPEGSQVVEACIGQVVCSHERPASSKFHVNPARTQAAKHDCLPCLGL